MYDKLITVECPDSLTPTRTVDTSTVWIELFAIPDGMDCNERQRAAEVSSSEVALSVRSYCIRASRRSFARAPPFESRAECPPAARPTRSTSGSGTGRSRRAAASV